MEDEFVTAAVNVGCTAGVKNLLEVLNGQDEGVQLGSDLLISMMMLSYEGLPLDGATNLTKDQYSQAEEFLELMS